MAKKKIMIVDDNEDLRYTVIQGIKVFFDGYDFIEAESGNDCIRLFEEGKIPDLVLLDIMMPGMDGWEVAAKLKENAEWKNVPIVFLTAKTDDMSRCLGSFASEDYVTKPFEIKDLKASIERALKKK